MLKLPAVVTREIDGFLPAADAVKRGLVAKESPEPVGTVGQPLGGELIRQTGNGTEFTKSESEEVSFVELRVKGEPAVAPGPAGLGPSKHPLPFLTYINLLPGSPTPSPRSRWRRRRSCRVDVRDDLGPLRRRQLARGAPLEPVHRQRAEGHALEPHDGVAHGLGHAPQLAVAAL